jgi:hypothetical protein
VALFWAWFWVMEFRFSLGKSEQRQLRSEYFTKASTFTWVLLTLSLIAAVAMVSIKLEGGLENVKWLIVCIPVHFFFGVIFISSVMSSWNGPVWLHPTSRKVLAFVGILDSSVFEAILVIVLLEFDFPNLQSWDHTPFFLALLMPFFTFLIMVIHIAASWSKKPPAVEVTWLQPRVLEFYRARNADKVSARVCWAAPGSLEKFPPCTEFRLEISEAGAAKLAAVWPQGADLGVPAPAEGYSACTQAWKDGLSTQDQFALLGNLEPSCRYLLRLTCIARHDQHSLRSFTRQGPLTLIETPDWPIASLEDIILTTTPPPHHEAAAPSTVQQKIISPLAYTSSTHHLHTSTNSGRSSLKSAKESRVPKTIPGPLFLRELMPSGGDQHLLYGIFEWLPQTHFDANILDLQLIEAGDGSEPHDYIMVFAGSELQVRVHNILPGSSYRVRLRAGDLVDGKISSAVERATLLFNTPTWQEVLEMTSQGNGENFAPMTSRGNGDFAPAATLRPAVGGGHQQANVMHAPYPHERSAPAPSASTALRNLRPEEPSMSFQTVLLNPQRFPPRATGHGATSHGATSYDTSYNTSNRPMVLPASAYSSGMV